MSRSARKDEILRAAARVFRRKGYYASRIQDVADEVGMHKGSLYYYIATKEDLLRGLVEGPMEGLVRAAQDVMATRHDPEQKLARLVELHLRSFQAHKDTFGIFLREDIDLLDRASDASVRTLVRAYDEVWLQLLREGAEAGVFHTEVDPRVAVKALVGLCNSTYTWFRAGGAYSIDEVARQFTLLILGGLTVSTLNSA